MVLDLDGQAPKSNEWVSGLNEVGAVSEFAALMERDGLLTWWRKAMGFL